jgi:WxcM-like, C-terminal
MSNFKKLNLTEIIDSRGSLCVFQDELPFEIKRLFWITNADGQIRGGHRHFRTRQALIAINGAVDIYINDGVNEQNITLNSSAHCLILEPEDWHTMHFHSGAILLVLASEEYDPKDYIVDPY